MSQTGPRGGGSPSGGAADSEESLQRAIADACLGATAGDAMARDLRGFLEARGVPEEDIAAILAAPPRLAVYRDLVRNSITSVVLRMLPRTRARMNRDSGLRTEGGEASDAGRGRFDADLAAFLDESPPRTHYLRDVPAEFLAWVEPRWRADPRIPPYLVDLASHELAQFAVGAAAVAHTRAEVGEIAIDAPLAFVESARIARHAWAVHELPADEDDVTVPPARDVRLLAYRDEDHAVRWMDLTPLAAAILERLLAGEPLGGAVERACAEHRTSPAAVLPDIARLLSDLGSRGVLLGARRGG
jgi:hypothetical protein